MIWPLPKDNSLMAMFEDGAGNAKLSMTTATVAF